VQFFHDHDNSGRRITYTSWWNRSTLIVSLTIIGVTQQHYNEPFVAPRTPLLSEREVVATDSVARGLGAEDRSSSLNEDVNTSSSVGVVGNTKDSSSSSSAEVVDIGSFDVFASYARSAGIDVVEYRKRYGNNKAPEPAPNDARTTGQPRPFADLCFYCDLEKFDPYSPACLRDNMPTIPNHLLPEHLQQQPQMQQQQKPPMQETKHNPTGVDPKPLPESRKRQFVPLHRWNGAPKYVYRPGKLEEIIETKLCETSPPKTP
jgi:hypothetical protein